MWGTELVSETYTKRMKIKTVSLAAVACAVLACSSSPNATRASTPPKPETFLYLGSLGSAGCSPGAAFHGWKSESQFPETGIDSKDGSFWALFFQPVPPQAGKDNKIVWRMTGSGDFVFTVSDSSGRTDSLTWGPELHGSSNWDHPGDEVGTGINFPHAGCWDIHVARTNASADLWVEVV